MSPPTPEVFSGTSSLTKRRDTYPFIDPFRFRHSLTGRIVLITNAHRGIGRASALDFAGAGATVVCTARTTQQLIPLLTELQTRHSTSSSYALAADFSDPSLPPRLVAHIEQNIGPIDVLLNITSSQGLSSFPHISHFNNDWWAVLELNLRAPIALIHAVLPSMIARRTGTIISTTFRSGVLHVPFTTSDSVAQSAILRFHHGLDDEVRPYGIYSYCVHPGIIASHLHDPEARIDSRHFLLEPRLQAEMTSLLANAGEDLWCGAGLASGTFLALCADPRAKVLSGLYVDAQRDLREVIEEVEKGEASQARAQGMYVLKVDEL